MKAGRYSEQCFFITGCSSGIGEAVAKNLMEQGAIVYTLGRRTPVLVDHYPDQIHYSCCDFDDLDRLQSELKKLSKTKTEFSGGVLCHGLGQFSGLEEFAYSQLESLVKVNLTSTIFMARFLLPILGRQPNSDLIFLGSESALKGGKKGAVYCATKFALRGFAQSLRSECQNRGLRISLINPGMVDSPFFDNLDFSPGEDPENAISVETVADTVQYILSSPSNMVFDEINLSPLKSVIRNK